MGAASEVVVVVIFVIELVLRIIASTRPVPIETSQERRQRRKLHWTWSRLLRNTCKNCCGCCSCCGCCNRCPCEDGDQESAYFDWFAQNMNEELGGLKGRDFAGMQQSPMRDK